MSEVVAIGDRKGARWHVRRDADTETYQPICSKPTDDGHMLVYQGHPVGDRFEAIADALRVTELWARGESAI